MTTTSISSVMPRAAVHPTHPLQKPATPANDGDADDRASVVRTATPGGTGRLVNKSA
jgi:hypothetical protein